MTLCACGAVPPGSALAVRFAHCASPSALIEKKRRMGKTKSHPREHYSPRTESETSCGSARLAPFSMQGESSGSSRRTGKERCGWQAARWWEPGPSPTLRTPASRPSGCLSKQARPESLSVYEPRVRDAAMQRPLFFIIFSGRHPGA